MRSEKLAHEFRSASLAPGQLGSIRGVAVGDTWIAAVHSGGIISSLDIRTGFHLAAWQCKGLEGEITQVKPLSFLPLFLCFSSSQS